MKSYIIIDKKFIPLYQSIASKSGPINAIHILRNQYKVEVRLETQQSLSNQRK